MSLAYKFSQLYHIFALGSSWRYHETNHHTIFVGSSSSQEEVVRDTVMSSPNAIKQGKLQLLKCEKVSAQLVYPSPLVQLIDDALKSGIVDEELSNYFHISLKEVIFGYYMKLDDLMTRPVHNNVATNSAHFMALVFIHRSSTSA